MKNIEHNCNHKIIYLSVLWIFTSQIATTIYLPSLPFLMDYFKTSFPSQYIFTSYIFAYALSQFICGSLSDIYGRYKIVISSLTISLLGSGLSSMARTLGELTIFCFIQGLGTGGLSVIARIIVADHFSDKAFIRASSYVSLSFAIFPLLGPVIGGYLQQYFLWQANFIFSLLLIIISVVATLKYYKSQRPCSKKDEHEKNFFKTLMLSYSKLLKDKIFLIYMSCGLIGMAAETAYEISAPFLLEEKLGLNSFSYGLVNLLVFLGYFTGSFYFGFNHKKVNLFHSMTLSAFFIIAGGFLMIGLGNHQLFNVYAIIIPMLICMIGLGIIFPASMCGILAPLGSRAGSAGALSAGLQNLAGVMISILIIHLPVHNQVVLGCILVNAAILIFIIINLTALKTLFKQKQMN